MEYSTRYLRKHNSIGYSIPLANAKQNDTHESSLKNYDSAPDDDGLAQFYNSNDDDDNNSTYAKKQKEYDDIDGTGTYKPPA